jgi:hypothetical protein
MKIQFNGPFLLVVLTTFAFTACIKEDHFGKSSYREIIRFSLPMQLGSTVINQDSLVVRIAVSQELDITNLVPSEVTISNFATLSPPADMAQDFSEPVKYTVTAEDGALSTYTIYVATDEPKIQVSNSQFQHWHVTNSGYLQPGANKNDTVWSTGNAGVNTFGFVNASPLNRTAGDTAVRLETLALGPLAQALGLGIGAGTIFTGTFKLNLANPNSSSRFGTPFIARPDSFSVEYKYLPATGMKNGYGQAIPGSDSADLCVMLEDRSSGIVKRVATAWYRTDQTTADWTKLKLKLHYGPLASPAHYEVPKPPAVWGTGTETPTHILVIFVSSARGDFYEGAPGSLLYVDEFRLYY